MLVVAGIIEILPANCQDDVTGKTIEGRVISVDAQNSQIIVKTFESIIFSVPSNAKLINSDGFDIQLSDITPGNYVSVDYYDDPTGHHIVTNIEVEYNR